MEKENKIAATRYRALISWALMIVIAFCCMFCADRIQRDMGRVEIEMGTIESPAGKIAYKLYIPKAAGYHTAPGVLLLHGYQNDHETNALYANELARRGVVVLSIDEYGHGSTTIGLRERGYVNQKVTVNYGNDSAEHGTFVEVKASSPVRYRIMMNFSNLSFFDPKYTQDSQGNTIADSSCGGSIAYAYLASLPQVDPTRLALSGHSMGTWSSWSVAADYCDAVNQAGQDISPKAIVLQCGELFRDSAYDSENIHFNNVLLLQAKYDEFSYFRDYTYNVTDDLLKTPLRYEFLKTTPEEAAWNTTYGDFADGSARRIELLNTNHRLTTHNKEGLAAALDWFDSSITLPEPVPSDQQKSMAKEWLGLVAMLLVLFSMFPLLTLLLTTPLFSSFVQPIPAVETRKTLGQWWRTALLSILLAGASFPFMTQLGHGLLPLPENIFRMTVGNGFLCWYLTLILFMVIFSIIGAVTRRKRGVIGNWYATGLGTVNSPGYLSIGLLIKGLILAVIMTGSVYFINLVMEYLYDLDLRFIWPFFRSFNVMRAQQFAVYVPVFCLFYLMNNTKIMGGLRTAASDHNGFIPALLDWLKNFFVMAGGILLVVALEYIPFFAGIGPGADVFLGGTFGGPFISILILFAPQVLFFSILCTVCYRMTRSVYVGAFTAAFLACWIICGGSAFL